MACSCEITPSIRSARSARPSGAQARARRPQGIGSRRARAPRRSMGLERRIVALAEGARHKSLAQSGRSSCARRTPLLDLASGSVVVRNSIGRARPCYGLSHAPTKLEAPLARRSFPRASDAPAPSASSGFTTEQPATSRCHVSRFVDLTWSHMTDLDDIQARAVRLLLRAVSGHRLRGRRAPALDEARMRYAIDSSLLHCLCTLVTGRR